MVWMACAIGIPVTSGTGAVGGPGEKRTVTTSPGVIGVLGSGFWLTIVLAGSWPLAFATGLIVEPPAAAAVSASVTCMPTKFGSPGPWLMTSVIFVRYGILT